MSKMFMHLLMFVFLIIGYSVKCRDDMQCTGSIKVKNISREKLSINVKTLQVCQGNFNELTQKWDESGGWGTAQKEKDASDTDHTLEHNKTYSISLPVLYLEGEDITPYYPTACEGWGQKGGCSVDTTIDQTYVEVSAAGKTATFGKTHHIKKNQHIKLCAHMKKGTLTLSRILSDSTIQGTKDKAPTGCKYGDIK